MTLAATVPREMLDPLVTAIEAHLHALVDGYADRHVGGVGNEHATAYVEAELRRQGWEVSEATFDAVDAEREPAGLTGEAWYESDHSIVAMDGRPAVALTSTTFRELCAGVTHTEGDTLDIVAAEPVAAAAAFVADLVGSLPADARGPAT
jgi:hypothetical protein